MQSSSHPQQNQLDPERREQLKELRHSHFRRLQVLERQAALTGVSTRPEVILEIEDIRATIASLDAEIATAERAPQSRASMLGPQQQRKQITLLHGTFGQLAELSEQLDPEEVAELLSRLWQRVGASIAQYGGAIAQQAGETMLAVWGAAAAREDDAEQAIRAALALGPAIAAFCQEERLNLTVQIGVSTGIAVLGAADAAGQASAVGEPATIAAELARTASGGEVLIGHESYRHTRGLFELQPLAPLAIAGRKEPLRAYRVQAARPQGFRPAVRGIEGIQTGMIGRDAELRKLQDIFDAVLEDRERAAVTIIGEAGLGKSRLLAEFDAWLSQQPATIIDLRGRASPASQQQPYALLRDMVARHFDIRENDSAQEVRSKLEQGFRAALGVGVDFAFQAALVGQLLGFGTGDNLPRSIATDARQIRDRGTLGLVAYVRALAERAPVLLLLEDIHWADDASLDVGVELVAALEQHQLLSVCTARPSLYERREHWGEGQEFHTRIQISPLSARDSRKLAEEILQKLGAVPAGLRDLLVQNAEGNPFYLEELIKMLIDEGAIRTDSQQWALDAARLSKLHVPTTLVGVLQARLDALAADQQSILQRAAVVGRVFWDTTLAAMAEDRRGEDQLPQLLAELRRRELIAQRERSAFADGREYAFKHALLCDVAYERVLKRARRVFHAAAARWLAQVASQLGRPDEYAPRIAEHYDQGGSPAEAAAWYERAGRHAAARFANPEALAFLNRALELTPADQGGRRYSLLLAREQVLDLRAERAAQLADLGALAALAEQAATREWGAEVKLRRANYALATGDYPAAIADAQAGLALAEEDAEQCVRAQITWGRALFSQASYQAAREQMDQAFALAEQNGLFTLQADCLRYSGAIAFSQGDYAAAGEIYTDALKLYSAAEDQRNGGRVLNNLGLVAQRLGDLASAQAHYEQALKAFRTIGDRFSEAAVLNNAGIAAQAAGAYETAGSWYQQALVLARQINDRDGEGMMATNLGTIAIDQGRYTEAQGWYEQGLSRFRELGSRYHEAIALLNLGDVGLRTGAFETASELLGQARELARANGDQHNESSALSLLALLQHNQSNNRAALASAAKALQLAEATANRSGCALALTHQGHALHADQQLDRAAQAYGRAIELRREAGQSALLAEPLAGLARVRLGQGDLPGALALVDQIRPDLDIGKLPGAYEPSRVFLSCFLVLQASGDQRARQVIEQGVALLRERAAAIADLEQRRAFLGRVLANRTLLVTMHKITVGGG